MVRRRGRTLRLDEHARVITVQQSTSVYYHIIVRFRRVYITTAAATKQVKSRARPTSRLPGHGRLIELCTDPHSNIGKVACEFSGIKVRRITEKEDLHQQATVDSILNDIYKNPGTSVHASIPCAAWCKWQIVNERKHGPSYSKTLKDKIKPLKNKIFKLLFELLFILEQRKSCNNTLYAFLDKTSRVDITGHITNGLAELVI